MADLSEQIAKDAAKPSSTTVDGTSVTRRPLTEEIEADKYLAAKEAAKKAPFGLTFAKIISPGAQS